ncbi:MAG: GIY-YIG nuclease family protein, partial [Bacteroidetes bacterium]|nr:GIY-YIG nuclease family protein [Bacteroidota bacterium]
MFDSKTITELKCYVYLLVDPVTKTPFYVGKGTGNRVFNHLQNAKDGKVGTEKLKEIRLILEQNLEVEHIIVRHGLNDKTAFIIEAALIDTFKYIPDFKTFVRGNIQGGVNSIERGLMSSQEIIRKYNAEPLDSMEEDCVIININTSYKKASGEDRLYQATKQIWKMADPRKSGLKYALSE